MLSYSIAIRTLGTSGNALREELMSVGRQTVPPEQVLIYLAEGYARPEFQIGDERYVRVRKGMMAQRILPYDEIESDCILMLDDDVRLAPDSAERLLRAMEESGADCVGADVFQNHLMPLKQKIYAVLANLVFPHRSRTWAFKMHRNGSFSYNGHPCRSYYRSQTCGGPAALWRKEAFLQLHLEDELWLDDLGFAYGEDALVSYKLYCNGGHLGICYDSGIENLDARTDSNRYRKSPQRFRIRSQAQLMTWWRSCYRNGTDTVLSRFLSASAFILKALWLTLVLTFCSLIWLSPKALSEHLKGLRDGWKAVHSPEFGRLPHYIPSR